jgi:hypothetical protein
MIAKGRHHNLHLYEVTEQDILLGHNLEVGYRSGNVLIFADKRVAKLGQELARADDISAAREFLDRGGLTTSQESSATEVANLRELLRQKDESLRSLAEKIEQRDELLCDVSESLKAQRQDNELLHAMLEALQEQLAASELSQNELVDDLQLVSGEARSRESALELVLGEKFQLEQELAERITELVEMNLQNDELRYQLSGRTPGAEARMTASPAVAEAAAGGSEGQSESQIVTVSSGKQIHIYHEFPPSARPSKGARLRSALGTGLRLFALIILLALLLTAVSTLATAQVNGISFGTALDLLIKSLTP